MNGWLIAFEGLDQSGKQTQADRLARDLRGGGRTVVTASFPDYATPIGREIGAALSGERVFGPDVMQLLYAATRFEWRPRLAAARDAGGIVVCDRYVASSVAYGEAQGLDPAWLVTIQQFLPQPDITIFLDIAPETTVRRKATGRDRYERDLALLARVRESYRRQSAQPGWIRVDGEADVEAVTAAVRVAVAGRLERP